jgi:TPR repeat protein
MNQSLKQVLLVCVCLFALNGQAIADSLSDATLAFKAKDYENAAKLIRPLAEQGNADAQSKLGWMYNFGQGVRQDYKEAEKLYRLAADQGDASAQFNLGEMYYYGLGVTKDYKEAVKWYRLPLPTRTRVAAGQK